MAMRAAGLRSLKRGYIAEQVPVGHTLDESHRGAYRHAMRLGPRRRPSHAAIVTRAAILRLCSSIMWK